MPPTDHDLATAAAARAAHQLVVDATAGTGLAIPPDFDDLPEAFQEQLRGDVAPLITAALAALPERHPAGDVEHLLCKPCKHRLRDHRTER